MSDTSELRKVLDRCEAEGKILVLGEAAFREVLRTSWHEPGLLAGYAEHRIKALEALCAEAVRTDMLRGWEYPVQTTKAEPKQRGKRFDQQQDLIRKHKERGLPVPQATRAPLSDKDKKARKKARKRKKRRR